jgi:serpin B
MAHKREIFIILLSVVLMLASISCATVEGTPIPQPQIPNSPVLNSSVTPVATSPASSPPPVVSPLQIASENYVPELVSANSSFAFDLYRFLNSAEKSNLFYSPYSISSALAMTYAGAKGDTATQMASTLHFNSLGDALPSAFKSLAGTLDNQGKMGNTDVFRLNVANALWGQKDYPFLPDYLDLVNKYFAGGLKSLDFMKAPEPSRQEINQWISDRTEGRIKDPLQPGAVDSFTRLVLTNAIYFNARWQDEFPEKATQDDAFYLIGGTKITTPMMKNMHKHYQYSAGADYQAISLPYLRGGFSMVILLPEKGRMANFERSLDLTKYNAILKDMKSTELNLALPKFKYESRFELKNSLSDMGMKDAFSPGADFSGMTGKKELSISGVIHQATVAVDEQGTEAAAMTAVMMAGAAPPGSTIDFTVDRPFIFLIQDNSSGTILFIGKVIDPRG